MADSNMIDSQDMLLANENIRLFTRMIVYVGISILLFAIILILLNVNDIITTIPITISMTLLSVATIGYIFERRGWITMITDRITRLMLNPEFLAKMGMKSEKVRENVLGLLKGGLSIEALDECFFKNLDEVFISGLLEPIHEDIIHNFELKLDDIDGNQIVRVNHFRSFSVVNPTSEEKKLFKEGIVDQLRFSTSETFSDIGEDEFSKIYNFEELKINGNTIKKEELTIDGPKKDKHNYWTMCIKYDKTLPPYTTINPKESRNLIEIKKSFVCEKTDLFIWGIKRLTRRMTTVIKHPPELDIYAAVVIPKAYPIVHYPELISSDERVIRNDEILYPGNAIVLFWRPKKDASTNGGVK